MISSSKAYYFITYIIRAINYLVTNLDMALSKKVNK